MKKILLTFFALSLVLSSCEFGEGFEEMNVDPNKASQLRCCEQVCVSSFANIWW